MTIGPFSICMKKAKWTRKREQEYFIHQIYMHYMQRLDFPMKNENSN